MVSADDDQLHILAFPFPIPGHINSLMHLCRSLVLSPSLNFRFTFLCPEHVAEGAIRARDLVTALDSSDSSSSAADRIHVVPLGTLGPKIEDMLELRPRMGHVLEDLIQKLRDKGDPIVCIICDSFSGWVQDVANKFEIPRAVLWTSNAINDVIHLHFPQLVDKGFVPVSACKSTELVDFLPGIPPMRPTDLPLMFHQQQTAFQIFDDMAIRFHEAEFALCNTFQELEEDMISTIRAEIKSKYYCVGPCLAPDFLLEKTSNKSSRNRNVLSAQDLDCLEWLDEQQDSSVIYVSFGSMATMSIEQAEELASGLEQSGHSFVLVLRNDFINSDDAEASEFIRSFVERTKDKGIIVPWAPQMQVLLHPAAGGFLTHCGWNSSLEAICAGVPLLAWPQGAEQNVNCREIVERWKIGIQVGQRQDSSSVISSTGGEVVLGGTISELVKRLMGGDEGEELRRRAAELREKARKCVAEGGSSYENLRSFAQALKDHVHKSHQAA